MIKLVKHFLIQTYTDGGEHYRAPNFFLLSLSAEDIAQYKELQPIAVELKERLRKNDRSTFHNLAVWDWNGRPRFFTGEIDADSKTQEKLTELLERAADNTMELTGDEAAWLDCLMEEHEGYETGGYQQMDYTYCVADTEGLHWRGCVKHCSYTVTTNSVNWEDLDVPG